MNKKPIQIVVLAIIQFLTPVFNMGLSSLMYHVKPLVMLNSVLHSGSASIIDCLVLGPLTGLAILAVRRWSYPIIVGGALYTFASNIIIWHAQPGLVPMSTLLGVNLFPLLLIGYFTLPSVRAVYFYPIVRWWEAKPRFQVSEKVMFTFQGKKVMGMTANISEGGMFLDTNKKLPLGKNLNFEFELLDKKFKVKARPVYFATGPRKGFGMQFVHNDASRKAMQDALWELDGYGVARSPDRQNVVKETLGLLKEVARGKQIVPTLSPTALNQIRRA